MTQNERNEMLKTVNISHGGSHSKLYTTWINMKARCYNPKSSSYSRYGGRGVTVCDEWLNDFKMFRDWAINYGYYIDGLVLDKDILPFIEKRDGLVYSPENCLFVTRKINNLLQRGKGFVVKKRVKLNVYEASYKRIYIGTYKTEELATQAYEEFKREWLKQELSLK